MAILYTYPHGTLQTPDDVFVLLIHWVSLKRLLSNGVRDPSVREAEHAW